MTRTPRPSPALVISVLALFVALSGWTYAATGGTFVLGKPNAADATTSLSTPLSTSPSLTLSNTGGGPAARFSVKSTVPPFSVNSTRRVLNLDADLLDGKNATAFLSSTPPISVTGAGGQDTLTARNSANGRGLAGFSDSWQGTYGHSNTNAGVVGESESLDGVWGSSHAAAGAGVSGHDDAGRGVAGFSDTWQGVYGHSNTNAGVVGESRDLDGVYGVSNSPTGSAVSAHNDGGGFGVWASGGNAARDTAAVNALSDFGDGVRGSSQFRFGSGVYGVDQNGTGVRGHSDNGSGVYGESAGGTGVTASSSDGYALKAVGKASQSRAAGGFVKAMAFVDPTIGADPIRQCFNSQLPAADSSAGNCGMTYNPCGTVGCYHIGFGFKVDDRFVSVTSVNGNSFAAATRYGVTETEWGVLTQSPSQNAYFTTPFMIFVY